MKWFNTLSHNRWLEQETDRILDFGKNAAVPTGFGWLGNNGQVRSDMGTHLWITPACCTFTRWRRTWDVLVRTPWLSTALMP